MGVLPTILPFTQICASTGAARSRTLPASFPACIWNSRTLTSCGGGPEEAIKWVEEPLDEPPDAPAAPPGIVTFGKTGLIALPTLPATEVTPAASTTACAEQRPANAPQSNAAANAGVHEQSFEIVRTALATIGQRLLERDQSCQNVRGIDSRRAAKVQKLSSGD